MSLLLILSFALGLFAAFRANVLLLLMIVIAASLVAAITTLMGFDTGFDVLTSALVTAVMVQIGYVVGVGVRSLLPFSESAIGEGAL